MIKSMTGFASLTREHELATIGVTIRSLNHRYLDLQVRLPQALAPIETDLRAMIQRSAARGRVELTVTLQLRDPPLADVEVNTPLVKALAAAVERLQVHGIIAGNLEAADLIRLPQVVTFRERPLDADTWVGVCEAVKGAVESAATELDRMRAREGEYLRADLETRRQAVADLVRRMAAEADIGRETFRARVTARLAELAPDIQTDPVAVAQEVVRLAARSDISEEVARLRGHLDHWITLATAPEPCGRTLDFLIQEMNREVNTIGSKAEGVTLPEVIVTAKAELEKLREQTQNVE